MISSKENLGNEKTNDVLSDIFTQKALNLFDQKKNETKVTLVNNVDTLAKKVEPGYLIKLAEEIEQANSFVLHSACGKLKLIENQINSLKKQALQILIETKINTILYSLPCNFSKKIGHIYSVYQKPTGEYYFSMITPEEWDYECPHKFIGSFKIDDGMTWIPVDDESLNSALRTWIHEDDSLVFQ